MIVVYSILPSAVVCARVTIPALISGNGDSIGVVIEDNI